MTLVASGQAASFGEAKAACEAAQIQAWRLSDIRRRLRQPVHINEGRTPGSYALILRVRSKHHGWRYGGSARSGGLG